MNNFNAGRYWPAKGPQETLYVPKSAILEESTGNTVVLFEIDAALKEAVFFVEFVDKPIWKSFPQKMSP